MTAATIALLSTGPARPLAGAGRAPVASGIDKAPRTGRVWLSIDGLEGDEQGDRSYHGGPEKALHHYAAEHYARWRTQWPDSAIPPAPGAFGENVSTSGMTERTVCIGDVYRAGTALLQVSQGRQPCWKLNRRIGRPDAALDMQVSGATGWYYRVLQPGALAAGDRMELIERPCPGWPLARLVRALYPPDLAHAGLAQEWARAAGLAPLSANWRETFARRLATGRIEDWTRRLHEA